MGYSTWVRVLSTMDEDGVRSKNRCPFTKKEIKKRDLIRLTWENINEHVHKCVNIPKDIMKRFEQNASSS
jgi:hypothetical protein